MRWWPLVSILAGCVPVADDARTALLHDTLVSDNAIYRTREPTLLHDKYARMAADRYDFMRGTARWFYVDVSRPHGPRETAGGLDLATSRILVVGDPHPENLGTVSGAFGVGPGPLEDAPPLTLEWVDLNATTWGPWTLDLRRAALGLAALAEPLPGCACVADAVMAMGDAYRDVARGSDRPPLGRQALAVLDEARREGAERKRREDRAPVVDGIRTLTLDDALAPDGRGMLAPTPSERARVDRILTATLPDGLRVLDVARRFGSGIASLPAERYQILADTGGDDPSDDFLLQVREVFDLSILDGLDAAAARAPPAIAHRSA